MVTSYYIMKMAKKNQSLNIGDYYSNLNIYGLKWSHKNKLTCRVCLKVGSIPIYDDTESSEIPDALHVFGNITISKNDDFPQHLCKVCYKFIKGAISFRKIAEESSRVLNQQAKVKSLDNDKYSAKEFKIELSDQYSVELDTHDSGTEVPNQSKKAKEKSKNAKVQCYVCNKIVTSSYFKEHVTMHDPNHHKYVCDICGKSFRLRCAYHNHSLRHRTDFPYKCQFCPYKARYMELLKTHMRTHTGDYRYMCTECPARFLFKSNLNRHILIKHKEPQYNCDECKKVFHTKIMLQRHHEVHHLGIKNHVCNLCGKAFGYRNAMMKHQRHVHKREKLSFCRIPSYLQFENKNLDNVGT